MSSRPKAIVVGLILAALVLGSCTTASLPASPAAKPDSSNLTFPGHWEVVRQLDYGHLAKADLKGEIGPAYLLYLVTLAGFHTETFGITVGPDDDVRYTTDSGQSWTKTASALHCRFGLEIVDEKIAWHCGNGGTRVSADGGQIWQTVAPSPCPYLSFLDAQIGWAASPYVLQVATNGGTSWRTLALPSDLKSIATIALRTDKDGYVLDTAGHLFVTADGGQSWQVSSLGLKPDERLIPSTSGPKAVMRFVDAQHGIVVFDLADRSVWFALTSDGGHSWQRAEITTLRDQSYYYQLYLTRDGRLLTVTDDFDGGANVSTVLRYEQP